MNEFDIKAKGWDANPMHLDRSRAIADEIMKRIPLSGKMKALEYGAGTGITSFLLKDFAGEITMVDSSAEMVRIMNEKIKNSGSGNLKTVLFDLEHNSWNDGTFDVIFTQMVLHHVTDIENIIRKFRNMLNPGGYLAIADLYPEDGSFHGEGFTGHRGFDTKKLAAIISEAGFGNISESKCFEIRKQMTGSETKQFDVFLLTAELR